MKPEETKPNTLPKAPGGVTERTSMSRDGLTMPANKPDSELIVISTAAEWPMMPISSVAIPAKAKDSAATVTWRVVREARKPPTSTPTAFIDKSPVSATFASVSGVP